MIGRAIVVLGLALGAAPLSAQVVGTVPAAHGSGQADIAAPALPIVLPALPLATGARLAGFCDSHAEFNHQVQATTYSGTTRYALNSRMSGLLVTAWGDNPSFNFDAWYDPADPFRTAGTGIGGANQGIGGAHLVTTSPSASPRGAMARLTYLLSRGPQIVWLNCGTNTISSGDYDASGKLIAGSQDAAYVEGKLDTMVAQATSRGVWVILSTLYPRADWPSGDLRHETTRQVNVWIRAQAGRAGVRLVDPYATLVSPTDPDGVDATLFQEGAAGVHLNAKGAFVVYRDHLKSVLAAMIAPGSVFNQDPAVANLLPASLALLNGATTGTKGTGTTGAVAAGQTVAVARGSSTATATIEDAGAYKRQVIVVTPVNDGASTAYHEVDFTSQLVTLASPPAPGTWVSGTVHVETPDALSASAIRSALTVGVSTVPVVSVYGQNEFSPLFAIPNAGRGGYWINIPPFPWPDVGTSVRLGINVYFPKAMPGTFTVKIDRPILRTIADPRGSWQLP